MNKIPTKTETKEFHHFITHYKDRTADIILNGLILNPFHLGLEIRQISLPTIQHYKRSPSQYNKAPENSKKKG